MILSKHQPLATRVLVLFGVMGVACLRKPEGQVGTGRDAEVTKQGSIEVTAKLLEVPEGAVFERKLYNYATVLKYKVLRVHRGKLDSETIFVGHYNPFKPRSQVADKQVKDVGGTLKAFRAGQVQRMALDGSIEDRYMGGVINKYFGEATEPIYWAVWTNLVSE
jgi:hypothetical protein